MITTMSPFSGFKPVRDYEALIHSLPSTGCTIHELGKSTDDEDVIYGLSYGDIINKPVLMLEGGIHGGTEWCATHYPLEIMRLLANPENTPQEYFLKYLTQKYAFFNIVCLNPYGYRNGLRRNKNNVDLNRNFDVDGDWYAEVSSYKGSSPFSEQETQVYVSVIQNIKPSIVLHCHEAVNLYLTMGGVKDGIHDDWRFKIEDSRRDASSLLNEYVGYYPDVVYRSRSRTWVPTQLSKEGHQIQSYLVESGPSNSGAINEEVRTKRGMNIIMSTLLNYSDFFKEHKILIKKGSEFRESAIMYKSGEELSYLKGLKV